MRCLAEGRGRSYGRDMTTLSSRPESTSGTIPTGWYSPADCDVADLAALCATPTDLADHPHADDVVQGVLVYGRRLREAYAGE